MNTYLDNAYDDGDINEAVTAAGFSTFQEAVSKMSLEGLSLAHIAERLGLVAQRFTAYHAKWMLDHAKPLNLEDV